MSSKVTELDHVIAANIRKFREASKLTQPQVAEALGITYQSYQRMEGGRYSFRASTLDRLARLYNKRLYDFLGDGEMTIDPAITKAQLILLGMTDDERDQAIRALLKIKHARGQQ